MDLPLRQQLLAGALLLVATAFGIRNIVEARNETAVGGRVHRLAVGQQAEGAAFRRLLGDFERLGHADLADRFRDLEARGALWIAPGLDPGHWALYVDTFGLVRRIYIRETGLLSPESHLYPQGHASITPENRRAFARVSLMGALFHELQHWDGVEDEGRVYDVEIAWLGRLRERVATDAADPEAGALDWGLQSAVLSARKARELALGAPAS